MERWVAQSIARRHGVCANVDFLFPRALLDRVFGCRPDLAPNPAWAPGPLLWSIARRLVDGSPRFVFSVSATTRPPPRRSLNSVAAPNFLKLPLVRSRRSR